LIGAQTSQAIHRAASVDRRSMTPRSCTVRIGGWKRCPSRTAPGQTASATTIDGTFASVADVDLYRIDVTDAASF
jgi:hypothetical protein